MSNLCTIKEAAEDLGCPVSRIRAAISRKLIKVADRKRPIKVDIRKVRMAAAEKTEVAIDGTKVSIKRTVDFLVATEEVERFETEGGRGSSRKCARSISV